MAQENNLPLAELTRSTPLNAGRQQHRDPCAVGPILDGVIFHEIAFFEEYSDENVPGSRYREHEMSK